MFNPQEFLRLAKFLLSNLQYREAVGRTAVSRAYYSAFLEAREKVKNALKLPRGKSVHWKVREAFKKMGYPNISGKLYQLSKKRGEADYNLQCSIEKEDAKEAIQLAENIINLVKKVR